MRAESLTTRCWRYLSIAEVINEMYRGDDAVETPIRTTGEIIVSWPER